MREGCILVTLDVTQLAGILDSVQQQQQQQKRLDRPESCGEDGVQDTFR